MYASEYQFIDVIDEACDMYEDQVGIVFWRADLLMQLISEQLYPKAVYNGFIGNVQRWQRVVMGAVKYNEERIEYEA